MSIQTADGVCDAHLHTPDGAGPWPAVVMYPDAGGVRETFQGMAQRHADLGYAVGRPSRRGQDPAERERDIVHSLLRLADLLVSGHDELELLRDLCESCLRILDADTAGILLGDGDRLGFVIATSEDMETIELFQAQAEEGPCHSAYRSGETVHSADLASDADRWPAWTPRALELGFRSAEAFPMRLADQSIGALNVYAKRVRPMNERDALVGRALADMATVGLLRSRASTDSDRVKAQLQHALDSRVVIEQAKGLLSGRHGIAVDEAFRRLRSHARSHNEPLRETAGAVIAGDLDL